MVPAMAPSLTHASLPQQRPQFENSQPQAAAFSHPVVPQSSPQPVATMSLTSPVSMTTGSTSNSIPITHTSHPFPQGNTVYGKLGSQNHSSTPNRTHLIDDRGGGISSEVTGNDGGGGSDRSSW